MCKNYYVASNGERQHAYCYCIVDFEGEPVCKEAQEIFWEEDINKMSLEVDRQTIGKMRALQKEQKVSSCSKLNCTPEGKPRSERQREHRKAV